MEVVRARVVDVHWLRQVVAVLLNRAPVALVNHQVGPERWPEAKTEPDVFFKVCPGRGQTWDLLVFVYFLSQ